MAPSAATARAPRVSIGVPVYNGARYLQEALDSVAAQTCGDFEVLLCDNASTDATPEICAAWVRRDARFRYHRNAANIGGDRNYNLCVEMARGEFFLGLAHDDVLAPEYLERCLDVLDRDPGIVFCHTRCWETNADGEAVGKHPAHEFSTSARPSERFFDATALANGVIATVGITRMTVLRQIAPLAAYVASDAFRQAELALRGRLVEIPEYLFSRRVYPESGSHIPLHERIAWSDPSRENSITFPTWRRLAEYAGAIRRTPLPVRERLRCFVQIGRFVVHKRWDRRLRRDVSKAAGNLLRRTSWGARLVAWNRRRGAKDLS